MLSLNPLSTAIFGIFKVQTPLEFRYPQTHPLELSRFSKFKTPWNSVFLSRGYGLFLEKPDILATKNYNESTKNE